MYRDSTDETVLAAIETAPQVLNVHTRRFEAFVDSNEISAAVLARAEAADAKSAQTLSELRSLAEVFRLAVNSVRNEIVEVVPSADHPPAA